MKLKNLFIGALAFLTTGLLFSCKEEEPIVPVDINISAERVEIDSVGGTQTLTLKSNRPWSVEKVVENPWGKETADWLQIEPMEGPASAEGTAITITAPKNVTDSVNYERSVIVYFRTDKELFASTVVYQGGVMKPNSWEFVSIEDVRNLAPEDKKSQDEVVVTKPWKVKAVVVSSSSPQTVSSRNLFVQDGTDPHSGLLVYSNAFNNCNFGDEVEITIKDGTLKYYFQQLEFVPLDDSKVQNVGKAKKVEYAEIKDIQKFIKGDYEGQYVKVYAQVIAEDLEKKMGEGPKVETEDGESFIMHSRLDDAPWGKDKVPQGAGDLFGLCNSYSGKFQIVPQKASDFAGLTGDRFTGRPAVFTNEEPVIEGNKVTLSGSYSYAGEASDITEVGIALKGSEEKDYDYTAANAVATEFSVEFADLATDTYKYKAYVKKGERVYEGKSYSFDTNAEKILKVSELTAMLKNMKDGESLASCATAVEGIVAANNLEGNHFKALCVVDGNGEPNSGIYLYGQMEFNDEFTIGDKVRVNLINAKLSIFNGWREIKWDENTYNKDVEVISHSNEFTIPEITVDQLLTDDYQSMYVTVKNVKSMTEDGATWYDKKDKNNTIVNFQDAENAEKQFGVKTNNHAKSWCDEAIDNTVTGNISGIASIYKKEDNPAFFNLQPVAKADVKAFIAGEAPEPGKENTIQHFVTNTFNYEDGTKLDDFAEYLEGIVVGNNVEGNFDQMLAVADGNGESFSGFFFRNPSFNEGFKIGDKVRISLKNAVFKIFKGTKQVEWSEYDNNVTVVSSNNEFTVKEVTAGELMNGYYYGQYVSVKDAQLNGKESIPWVNEGEDYTMAKFVGGYMDFTVKTLKTAKWSKEMINPEVKTNLKGVAQPYFQDPMIVPITREDIKPFTIGGEPEPAAMTVKEFAAKLKGMNNGDALSACGESVEGIIAANNAGGNLFKALCVVDGTGEPGTGIYVYGQMDFNDMKIGDKVKISLANAKLSIYNGWREVVWDEGAYNADVQVIGGGNKFTTPQITVDQLLSDEYQSMYVTVKDVKSTTEDGATWYDKKDKNSTIWQFQDAAGKQFGVKTAKFAKDWCEETINNKVTANISGVANIFQREGQEASFSILPVTREDVKAFIGGGEPEPTGMTIKELAAKLKGMNDGDALSACGESVEGIIAANNAGGNLFKALCVVDGTGEPGTGIYVYGQMDFNDMKIGDKVKISLANAKLSIYNGWREVVWDEGAYNADVQVIGGGNKFTTPQITVEQLLSDEYQSMYVTVKDVKSTTEDGATWYDSKDKNSTIWQFQDASGKQFGVKTAKFAKDWCGETINNKVTANISGVANIFQREGQEASFSILPVTREDVKAFSQSAAPEPAKPVIEGTKGDGIYTSNANINDDTKKTGSAYLGTNVKIDDTEYPCVKLGKTKGTGGYKVALGKAGDIVVTVYAMAWKDQTTNLAVQVLGGGNIDGNTEVELAIQANEGASGNAPYTIVPGEKDFFTISVKGATENTELHFTTEGMKDKRAIMYGINIK